MAAALQDVLWADGRDNDAGIKSELYYIPLSHISSFPVVTPNPAVFADLVTLVGDFGLFGGRAWKRIYGTLEKGGITSSMVGERDGKSFENSGKFFHPGSNAELLGFIEYMKNTSLVILIRELDGQLRVIGNKNIPAKIEVADHSTGEAIADLKGAEITIKSVGRMASIYTGAIQVVPGANSNFPYTLPYVLS